MTPDPAPDAGAPAPGPPARRRNPWWIPPFLGRVPADLEPPHLSLLGAVAFALVFEEYDMAMITTALPYIARDLDIAEPQFGFYLGLVRLGALPAVFLIPFADRIGRRRMFLASVVASALGTVATGFAWSAASFVFFQMLVRTSFVAGVATAYVLISEEFPPARRGWGMGVLAALGATGYGLEAALFSQIEHLPHGWRFLYWVGVTPLVFLPLFRRTIPETGRFARHQATLAAVPRPRNPFEPFLQLLAASPRRFLGLSFCMASIGFAGVAAFQFTAYYTIDVLGWSPQMYATMFIVGGTMGIVGNVVAGHLGDRLGRRAVGFTALAIYPAFVALFYWGPGWAVPLAWVGFVFTSSAGRMILRAFSTELFATGGRGTASGWMILVESTFSAGGLLLLWLFSDAEGDLARLTPLLALATLAGALVLLRFPETRSRELESISP